MHLDCLKELSYEIRGAAMDVYNELGPGLLESVYEKALIHEFKLREIDVVSQIPVNIVYKGELVGNDLRIDLLVEDTVIIELKSVEELKKVHDFVKGMVKIKNYDFHQ